MVRWLAALALVALGVPSGAAAAQQQFTADGVSGEVVEVLGDTIGRGWSPVRVSMRNRVAGESRTVRLTVRANYSNMMARSRQDREVELGPGESRTVEIYLPCDRHPGATTSMYMNVVVNGENSYINLESASEERPGAGRTIAVVGADRLSDTDLSRVRKALEVAGRMGSNSPRGLGDLEIEPIPTSIYFGSHGLTTGQAVANVAARDLPERALGWSGVDTVVVDTRGALPRDPRWEAIADWVRIGGQVVVVGPDAAAAAAGLPGLRDLVDERTEVTLAEGGGEGTAIHRAGLGLISVQEADGDVLFEKQGWRRMLGTLDAALPGAMDESDRARSPSLLSAIYADIDPWATPPERKALPVRLVLFFLFLFAIAAGPAAVWWTRQRGRPDLLFLSVPALSIAATLLLLAYGIGREGFAVKGNGHSLAILDQREDGLCTTVMRRELFAGRGGFALQPKPGTVVMVHDPGFDDRRRVVQDSGSSMRLGGAFLPVREQTSHIIARTAPARVRVEVEPEGDAFRVTNGLGVDIEAFALRTPDGETFHARGPVGSGETAALTRGPLLRIIEGARSAGDPLFAAAEVPRGGYVARVAASPTADDCAVPMEEIDGQHLVVGYLPLTGKEWTR